MWSDRNHYHPPLVEKSSRGGWCRRKAPSSNFSLARCSNFRQHGKGNQIQSRENTVCSIVRALRGEALAPFHRILISLFKQESKGCRYSALDLIVSSVGSSTPWGEHAADLVSRRGRNRRWNTFKHVFLREKTVVDGISGFNETFIRWNTRRNIIMFNRRDLSSCWL